MEHADWTIDLRVANSIASAASVLAVIMWMAPIRDVWTAPYSIFKTRSTENVISAFGFVAGTFNCILWNMFASTRLDKMMIPFIINCIGFALNVSFVLCYFCYGDGKARREVRNQMILMLFVTALSIVFWVVENDNNIVGYFAAFVNVLMLFGPLAAANEVIRNRSSKGMSLLPMVMTLASAATWLAYNVYIKELPGVIPNALGVLFGIMQLFLYAWARAQERKMEDHDILDDEFQHVVDSGPTLVDRRRAPSLGTLIAEGP